MVWVHIDSTGQVDCSVNVGNLVRQGNPIELFVVIEGMDSDSNAFELTDVAFIRPTSTETIYTQSVIDEIEEREFHLGDPSKANAFFRDSQSYRGYPVTVPASATMFEGEGGHAILIFIGMGAEEHRYLGRMSLYVNPTYGKRPTSMTHDDIEHLLDLFDEVKKYLDGETKIVGSETRFEEETFDGKIYRLFFELANGTILDSGTFDAPRGDRGPRGLQGLTGPQGPRGNDGVAIPANCLFTLYIDSTTGKLMASYPEGATDPSTYLSIDPTTGRLIYTY